LNFADRPVRRKECWRGRKLWTDPWTSRHDPDVPRQQGGSVYFIIHWIEQRGMSTYNIGFVCV
jgi:hypothetical protein